MNLTLTCTACTCPSRSSRLRLRLTLGNSSNATTCGRFAGILPVGGRGRSAPPYTPSVNICKRHSRSHPRRCFKPALALYPEVQRLRNAGFGLHSSYLRGQLPCPGMLLRESGDLCYQQQSSRGDMLRLPGRCSRVLPSIVRFDTWNQLRVGVVLLTTYNF